MKSKCLLGMLLMCLLLSGAGCSSLFPRADLSPSREILVQLSADDSCNPGRTFTQTQMREYLECVLPLVTAWNDTVGPHPAGYYMVPRGVKVDAVHCPLNDLSFLYCSDGGRVFVGEAAVWAYYTVGKAVVPAFIAHEITHHLQYSSGKNPGTMGPAQIPFENHADCGAGAFMAWAVHGGIFTSSDVALVSGIVHNSGQEGPERDHGTQQQRQEAFNMGLTQPMAACDQFISNQPHHG